MKHENENGIKTSIACVACFFFIILSGGVSLADNDKADRVMVIFNNYSAYTYDQNLNGLQDSYELALFYAAKRDIPLRNLLGVNCTRGNTYYYSGNTSYPTFLSEIDVPVKNKLMELGEENIDYFAMIYGIPYQITPTTDKRSLDGYIAIPFDLDNPGTYGGSTYGESSPGIPPDKGHFNHTYKSPYKNNTYLVSRLDGRYVDQIRDQVYGALYGETYLYNSPGYYRGIGYVDNRWGSYSDNFSGYPFGYGTYANADKSIAYAYRFFADKGYPYKREVTEALIGDPGATFLDGSDASIAENATLYGGWYSFGTYRDAFRWLPGSVACDYNSNSVSLIRNGAISFGYEAMRDGLTSVVGVIDEPYLGGHPMPEVLLYYLLNGYSLAESARLSNPILTWRSITIGDPIYTPFAEKIPVIDSSFSRQLTVFDDTVTRYSGEQRKISVYLTEGPLPELAIFRLECWNASGYNNITDYNIDYRFKKEFTLLNLSSGTTYFYRITARDPNGNTIQTPVLNFTTYANNSATIPTLTITRNRMSANTSESVTFNSTSNCTDCTYTWSFGDGSEYIGRNATHSYSQKGVYDVFLHAISGQGVEFTKRSIVYVLNGSSQPPQTCSQLGGSCCSAGQLCQGGYLSSSDCPACCTGTCRTPSCGDTYCDSEESCSSCAADCLSAGQVCCSGFAYTGNCCSDADCSSLPACVNHFCSALATPPDITFVSPTPDNMADVSANYIYVNALISETPAYCSLDWFNGTWNTLTMTISGMNCYLNMTGLSDGTYQFMVAATDMESDIGISQTRQNTVAYSTPPSNDLVGHWKFDEGSGTVAQDSSGNSNTGTLVNGPVFTTGKFGSAIAFDGIDDYADVTKQAGLHFGTNDFSVSLWVKTLNTAGVVISDVNTYSSANRGWTLRLSSGKPQIWITDGSGVATSIIAAASVNNGNWRHVALVFDRDDNATIYIDGAPDKSASITNEAGTIDQCPDITIGAGRNSGTSACGGVGTAPLNSAIDELSIWNRALSAAEIQALYTSGPVSCFHKSDNNPPDGCVDSTELTAFIARWKVSNVDVILKELMEAIGFWKKGC